MGVGNEVTKASQRQGIAFCQAAIIFITADYVASLAIAEDSSVHTGTVRFEFNALLEVLGPQRIYPVVMDASLKKPTDWKGDLAAVFGLLAVGRFLDVSGITDYSGLELDNAADEIESASSAVSSAKQVGAMFGVMPRQQPQQNKLLVEEEEEEG